MPERANAPRFLSVLEGLTGNGRREGGGPPLPSAILASPSMSPAFFSVALAMERRDVEGPAALGVEDVFRNEVAAENIYAGCVGGVWLWWTEKEPVQGWKEV